ncbi:MAG: hypothetical protein JRH18_07100 [Deltaproteobacteria bacterium]|nr:hypothetical protein [Deltaproteobacteria bacterium]MBW1960434.1 hypothetical protein [Deltaproteobacteria bacterium]MBW1993019.1 hypothetical protein [Deltaproteobacteria bacterium]MBW2151420.1 hypothetical protein [Deltaproteobacteria bacterium]
MDVLDYCKGMEMELTAWKAKLYDLTRKVDRLSSAEKQRMLSNVEDLHILLTELEDRIENLRNECPSDPSEWSPRKEAIDRTHVDMHSKYEEALSAV